MTLAPTRDLKEHYGPLLRSRGLRATDNRSVMLGLLDRPDYKPTISQLYRQMQQQDPELGHSAVYLSVNELILAGLLRPVIIMGRAHLDGYQQPHHNLICRSCGAVESIPLQEIPTSHLWPTVTSMGYHIKVQGLDLEVVCPKCLS